MRPDHVQPALYHKALAVRDVNGLLYDGYHALQPENIARIITDIIALPAHADVTHVEIFPTRIKPPEARRW